MYDKEYLIESKIKNNLLYKAIFSKYKSISEFCRIHNIGSGHVSSLINLKEPILTKKGEMRECVVKICDALNMTPDDLFPARQWHQSLKINKIQKEIDEEEVLSLEQDSYQHDSYQLEDLSSKDDLKEEISLLLSTLSPREERIVRMHFGIDGVEQQTLDQIAKMFNVSNSRIQQIVQKALRKLQHPKRCNKLKVLR
jgi:RNA polymerase sigma factor (sigma-70 family)